MVYASLIWRKTPTFDGWACSECEWGTPDPRPVFESIIPAQETQDAFDAHARKHHRLPKKPPVEEFGQGGRSSYELFQRRWNKYEEVNRSR